MTRICFVLPMPGTHPVGGIKIVYQYATGLARTGHDVSVVHTCFLPSYRASIAHFVKRCVLRYVRESLTGEWRPDGWFRCDPAVRLRWIPTLKRSFLPRADVYVATWWQTAERLARWDAPARKLYLIQGLETWGGPKARVMATWKAPLEKIVISRWLEGIAARLGEHAFYIPNGLESSEFGIDTPIENRDPLHIAMLYSPAAWKGSQDGLQALALLKARFPALQAELFGVTAPSDLPTWIRYSRNPGRQELRAMYNRAAIFLAPSWSEGWALPPAEAMMSGAAVVATDIGGHREYCQNGQTALLAPPHAPERLAQAASTLLNENALRISLAHLGSEAVHRFTWGRALSSFEEVLATASPARRDTRTVRHRHSHRWRAF